MHFVQCASSAVLLDNFVCMFKKVTEAKACWVLRGAEVIGDYRGIIHNFSFFSAFFFDIYTSTSHIRDNTVRLIVSDSLRFDMIRIWFCHREMYK